MMLSYFIGKQIFRRNLKYCLSLILIISAAMLSCAVMITSVSNINSILKTVSPLRSEKGIYRSIDDSEPLIDGLANVKTVETVTDALINSKNNATYKVSAVSETLSDIRFPLLMGRWIDYDPAAGVIEAVVTEDAGLNLGDTFETDIAGREYSVLIVGILPNNTQYLSFSGFGTSGFSDLLKYRGDNSGGASDYNRLPLIICGNYLFEHADTRGSFELILFENNISAASYNENARLIQNSVGLSKTIEQLFMESENIKSQQLSIYVPVIVILAVLGIFVLIAVIGISCENSGKAVAAAYLSGGTYKTIFRAYLIFSLSVMLLSIIVYCASFIILVKNLYTDITKYGSIALTGVLVPVITTAVIIICTAVISVLSSKKTIVEYIKRERE